MSAGAGSTVGWTSEKIYQDPDRIFDAMIQDMREAKKSIDFESFIFERDAMGERLLHEFVMAASRGVKVRVLLDGVGSPEFDREVLEFYRARRVRIRIYRPWRAFFQNVLRMLATFRFRDAGREIVNMNRRNHRKTCTIDGKIGWVGSANVTERHLAWRETFVRLEGTDVAVILQSFRWLWERSRTGRRYVSRHFPPNTRFVHCSYGLRSKRKNTRFRRALIDTARHRIRLVNPYFIPPVAFLIPLFRARQEAVRVQVMIPAKSDYLFVEWISKTYYEILIYAGVEIYEYQAGMIHSKVLIADSRVVLGSSNYNFRSFLHDMEIDVLLTSPRTLEDLDRQWQRDLESCRRLDPDRVPSLSIGGALLLRVFAYLKRLM